MRLMTNRAEKPKDDRRPPRGGSGARMEPMKREKPSFIVAEPYHPSKGKIIAEPYKPPKNRQRAITEDYGGNHK